MGIEQKHCMPQEKGTLPLDKQAEDALLEETKDWKISRDGTHRLEKQFLFDDFRGAMAFANSVADIANAEDHHPDLHVSYGKVNIELSTHKIGGLSKNDFILAAKIDRVQSSTAAAM